MDRRCINAPAVVAQANTYSGELKIPFDQTLIQTTDQKDGSLVDLRGVD